MSTHSLNLYEPPSEASPDTLPPSLKTLPPELKEQIARFVDPIGLFSLRFIDREFRNFIQLQKQQHIERLLVLECRVTNGGPPLPFFYILYDRPVWSGDAHLATRSRWACAGCVQLLPYHHFQNKFLAEVIWRKPRPGSPAANIITSWEPVPASVATPTPLPADGGRSIQDAWGFLDEGFWGLLLDQEVSDARGTSRHHRKCNECLFRDGFFNSTTIASNHDMFGTERFPIISIEDRFIRSSVDRYFPGILDNMQQGRPPVLSFREGIRATLWMARCPRCAKWQELRAFRFGGNGSVPRG
ncbi:hypothetical protein FNAPI_2447 [Fusarium napiforme]|uniref:F-box domain-containing protein n=1 Tax=Fusarium napiforme TaxID=42672 RepID=A0A8H5JZZ8_9HYPO|nr:hypothetical protein FNAPI_2447 [Fusarium napiforme]